MNAPQTRSLRWAPRSCITVPVFGLVSRAPGEYQKIAPTPRKT